MGCGEASSRGKEQELLSQGFSCIGLTARLAKASSSSLCVGLLMTLHEAERRNQVGDP